MRTLVARAFLTVAVALAVAGAALAAPAPYIVVLRADSGAVHAAKARRAGAPLSSAQIESYRAGLRSGQDAFLSALSGGGIPYSVATARVPDFSGSVTAVALRTTLVLNSVTLVLEPAAASAIALRAEVLKVERARQQKLQLDRAVDYVRAPGVYGVVPELGPNDDLHEGFEGQGIKVAVIDTGIEWSHEMFGGDPTPPRHGLAPEAAAANTNKKVIYYLSFLENLADDFGHGTHVASDAAGYRGFSPGPDGIPNTGDDLPIHGVAPQARLMGYKVCDGILSASTVVGGCLTPLTVLALEDAMSPRTLTGFPKPVADVVNLSLGGPGGPDDSTALAADGAALLGAVVVAAAGNEGPGERTLGSPAAGRHVLAVAATNDPGVFANSVEVLKPGSPRMLAFWAPDSNLRSNIEEPLTARYVYGGFADTPEQVPATVAGNICLVERGSTAAAADQGSGLFANKAAQCTAKGAIAVVAFNNVPGELEGVLAPAAIPVFTISRENGLYLRDALGFDALGVSNYELRLNPADPDSFVAGVAGFSSRGPVAGLGQVKPDVAAPGVAVLAATSPLGVPVTSMQDATRYIAANGTSFASPITAGATALVRQAHLDWSPAEIRTAFINTATNPRSAEGLPAGDGAASPDILSQGGGLIDVSAAARAPALLGVLGDGLSAPEILGSHSFGEVPVANSRVSHSESVEVTLRDVSGEGGSYSLAATDNRGLGIGAGGGAGATVTVSPSSLVLAPGGEAQTTVTITIDGNVVREPRQLQWFVVASGDDGSLLRMPCYLSAIRSIPTTAVSSETVTYTGMVPASDTGLEAAADVTYVDLEVPVSDAVFQLDGHLDWEVLVDGTLPDLDLALIDAQGNELDRSTNSGGPEDISAFASGAGTYVYRVIGWLGAATEFTLTSTQRLGGAPPALAPIGAEWTNGGGKPVDFDGSYQVQWTPVGGETGFEIERSRDGGAVWTAIAQTGPAVTSLQVTGQTSGNYSYRVRSFFPARIGRFVSPPSAPAEVLVSTREQVKMTKQVNSIISNVALTGGVFQLDLALTNKSGETYLPIVEFNVVTITSASGTVRALNADNGGGGRTDADPALYDYSYRLGADEALTPSETSGTRTLRFADPASELFTFQALVTGFQGTAPTELAGGQAPAANHSSVNGSANSPVQLLQFTVNPVLSLVTVKLVSGIV